MRRRIFAGAARQCQTRPAHSAAVPTLQFKHCSICSTMPSIDLQHQPLEACLNDKAIRALTDLPRTYASDRRLQEHLRGAASLLCSTVSDINEAKLQRRDKHTRQNDRLQQKGEEPNDDDDVKEFESRVDSVTEKMDIAIRRIVDDRVWFENLSTVLKHVGDKSRTGPASQTQTTQRSTQLPTQDATPRHREIDEDGNEIGADEDDEDAAPAGPPRPEEAPNALLAAALTASDARHSSKSLTDRYAHDNDYTGFYKALHDARHSNKPNAPIIPAPALWFGREEGRTTSAMSPDLLADEDTEIGVVAERISTKCPLTIQYFKDPVTSDVCHHSYERSAILDFLKTSNEFMPMTEDQQRELAGLTGQQLARKSRKVRTPRVHCPNCNQWVTEADLRANPVLQRQARRAQIQEAKDRQEHDEDDDDESDVDDLRKGTQRRPFGVGSSPATRDRLSGIASVKKEMLSGRNRATAGSSQLPRGNQDVEDDEEGGMTDEDENSDIEHQYDEE